MDVYFPREMNSFSVWRVYACNFESCSNITEVEIRIIVYMVKCPNISVIDWSVMKFDWSPQLSLQSTL